MKNILAVIMAAFFLFSACIGVTNVSAAEIMECETVKTYIDVEIGKTKEAVFLCDITDFTSENTKSVSKVELMDENGNKLKSMTDNGTKGDNKQNDGIYSSKVTLSSDERKLVTYTAYVNGAPYKEYEINYYKEFTKKDEQDVQSIYDGINAIESNLEAQGKTDKEIFTAVKDYLEGCDEIESMEVSDVSICYTTNAGIASMYGRLNENTKGTGDVANTTTVFSADGSELNIDEIQIKGNESLQSWTNPNVLCVRPYRNYEGEDGFHNDRHTDAAKLITKYTNGYITALDNEQTAPYRLLETFWQNGFIMVDSHGLTGYGNSYMSVWNGDGYSSGDVTAHRVMKTNTPDHVWVGGSFFRYYYEKENKTLDNTFLYFGICFGMTEASLREELFALGAVCAYGYDASVTMGYEGYNVLTMYPYLTTICKTDTTRTYNLEETIAEGIRVNGDVDPYANTGARLQMAGDTKFVVYKPDVKLTGAQAAYSTLDATVGANCYVDVKLTPENMVYGYAEEWISSNTDVVEIVGSRTGYCKSEGDAVITGKYTYEGDEYIVKCTVHVSEVIPQSVEATCSGSATVFKVGQKRQINATIYPLDSSDKTICYMSNNPGAVTVDETGAVYSICPGKAIIRVYAKSNPEAYKDIEMTVSDNTSYRSCSEMDCNSKYMLVTNDSYKSALCANENTSSDGYLIGKSMTLLNGYYTGNITAVCLWEFVKANGGYYIYNSNSNKYLAMGSDEESAAVTAEPESIFNINDEGRIYCVNPAFDTDCVYLRFRKNKGFYFETSGTKFKFGKEIVFNSESFITATFIDEGKTIATQVVEKGDKAVAPKAFDKNGKTFLGWDKCLANVSADFSTEALFEDGICDNIVVTFFDYDGTKLAREEYTDGILKIPQIPEHEGMTFIGWSEDITSVNHNMTVFAMYSSIVPGDVTGDNKVNTGDAVAILKYAAEMISFDETQLKAADVTGDDKVNTGDAVAVLKYAAGIITEF